MCLGFMSEPSSYTLSLLCAGLWGWRWVLRHEKEPSCKRNWWWVSVVEKPAGWEVELHECFLTWRRTREVTLRRFIVCTQFYTYFVTTVPNYPSKKTDQCVRFVYGQICPALLSFRCIFFISLRFICHFVIMKNIDVSLIYYVFPSRYEYFDGI